MCVVDITNITVLLQHFTHNQAVICAYQQAFIRQTGKFCWRNINVTSNKYDEYGQRNEGFKEFLESSVENMRARSNRL